MKFNFKLMGLVMLVMLICCVSAASATDVDNITVPDDTDVIEIDDAVDSVDEVESDVANKDVVNQGNLRGANINGNPVSNYFDSTTGVLLSNVGNTLTFGGDFYNANYNYDNFIINRAVTINANASDKPTLHDMGFELVNADGITLDGITFDMTAPDNADCYVINVLNVDNTNITDNVINYTCNHANAAKYNHVIRVVGGENVSVSGNNITAYLPLKNVDFTQTYPSIYTDKVAGVAVQSSNYFRFTNNRLLVNVSKLTTGYPTLDAFIIAGSKNAYISGNTIIEIDNKTTDSNNYLYAVDVYQCDDITIDNNTIRFERQGGSIIPGTNNGTSAAYGIQLTGGHTGVTISNNNIHTSNDGPNCGIYSQNFLGDTSLTITNNTIYVEGNAGLHSWSLVTGMELGDNYAYVEGNNITVVNKAPYESGANAYGISYSQWCPGTHTYEIYDNTVEVINGYYSIYLSSSTSDSEVSYNCLNTTYSCCDNSVYADSNIVHDNYCPNCNGGSNCHC